MAFTGWSQRAIEFFEGIEAQNDKAFWAANKAVYQSEVLEPMLALLAAMSSEFGEGRVFRPYRDTRFSADKSPYKTNIAAHNDFGYITLSADALGVGTGLYMPATDQLARFRAAVADDRSGKELVGIVAALRKSGIEVSAHETVKTAPRGYKADHPRIDLLRQKGITAWKEWPVGPWLATSEPQKRITGLLRTTSKLRSWLDAHVGLSQPD